MECASCEGVRIYTDIVNNYIAELSETLIGPMWGIFAALVALMVVWEGIKLILGTTDLASTGRDLLGAGAASGLLVSAGGGGLVNQVYTAALSVMSSGASVALTVGNVGGGTTYQPEGVSGIDSLVRAAEAGVFKVFGAATAMLQQASMTDPSPILFCLVMIIPYVIFFVLYFAQVMVALFRVMALSALSPVVIMFAGFKWGRPMLPKAVQTLVATCLVLFSCSVALGLTLYALTALAVGDPETTGRIDELMSWTSIELWVIIIMGWLGVAFLAEANSIANSIAGTSLSLAGAGIITLGTLGSAALAGGGAMKNLRDKLKAGPEEEAGATNQDGKRLAERLNTPMFDRS